ncbi:MAG: hypothetical protein ACLU9S_09635 [Oscillospiraceae bacterium]
MWVGKCDEPFGLCRQVAGVCRGDGRSVRPQGDLASASGGFQPDFTPVIRRQRLFRGVRWQEVGEEDGGLSAGSC